MTTSPTSTGDGNWVRAKNFEIAPLKNWQRGDLDDQWSACNGVDGFGHCDDDAELNKARRRHGECLDKQPGCPRLILFRPKRDALLIAKLWYTRSFESTDDVHGIWASFAKALFHLSKSDMERFSVDLIDWDANRPEADRSKDGRYELSIECCGYYRDFDLVRSTWRQFMKHFDELTWA